MEAQAISAPLSGRKCISLRKNTEIRTGRPLIKQIKTDPKSEKKYSESYKLLKGPADKIESIHLYSSGTKGLRANMCSAGAVMTVDFIQSFSSPVYYDAFTEIAGKTGIPFSHTPLAPFDTPKDKAQITAGHQSERFKVKKIK